ncbi:hypothetical protein, partial [Rugamonas brunnea]|uniref:hypothetical protein n=1 Tax=Rugamonas brunnea TaxID=2758569 RepID=UPI001C710FB7
GLLQDGDDLAVGKTGGLHAAELSKIKLRKFYFQTLSSGGGITALRAVSSLSRAPQAFWQLRWLHGKASSTKLWPNNSFNPDALTRAG